jgi:hypothetical protein
VTQIRFLSPRTLAAIVAVGLLLQLSGRAQTTPAAAPLDARRVTFAAMTQDTVAESTSLIARMLQAGELTSVRIQDDPQIAGRQIQSLQQVYKGIPVEGGNVTLQKAGPTTVSVFGTLFNSVSVDTTPALAPIDAPATPMDTRPGSDAIEHLDGGVPDAPNVDFDAGSAVPDAFFLDA